MRLKFCIIVLLCTLIGCKKATQTGFLNGVYIEKSPVMGRSQFEFLNGNIVIKTEKGSAYKDAFTYMINGEYITLTPTWSTQYSGTNLTFKIINDNTFQIGNLYPSIPELPPSLMTFQK